MRVVLLCDYGDVVGGAEKVAISSAKALASAGVPTHFLAGCGPLSPDLVGRSDLTASTVFPDNPHETWPKVRALANTLWSEPSRQHVREVLANYDPRETIVHAHSFGAVISSGALGMALDLGFRVALTLHDYGFACPAQVQYDYRKGAICTKAGLSLPCVLRNCTFKSYVAKARLVMRSLYMVHKAGLHDRLRAFVTISELSESVLRPYFSPEAFVRRVPNPIDVEQGERIAAESGESFVFVGRLVYEKDPVLLARAARAVGASAAFVGDGIEKETLRRDFPEFTVTGWVRPEEVGGWLERARALVLTSRWYENSPLVVFEALSRGLPAIVADTCAAREYIVDGENGFIFRCADADDLADKLRQLQDDATAERMSRAAYERYWSEPLTLERHVERLRQFYADLLVWPNY